MNSPAPSPEEIKAKLAAIAAGNETAQNEIKAYLGAERWNALMQSAAQRRISPEEVLSLCGKLRRSRKEWGTAKGNDKAALILAANHFVLDVGGRYLKADEEALKAALNPAPVPVPEAVPEASPAPAPAVHAEEEAAG